MLTLDKKRRGRGNPVKTRGIEMRYGSQLTKVAQQVGAIIRPFTPGDMAQVPTIQHLLTAYADMLQHWAMATAGQMLEAVNHSDQRAWQQITREMSRNLQQEIRNAPTGDTMRRLLGEQVELIKSIPLDAAERVHRLTLIGLENSTRASEIATAIQQSGEVARNRAVLIARTEVGRTASTLTEARAVSIGSPGYYWETSGDGEVRKSHKAMQGQFVLWSSPPTLDDMTGHAGCSPNCRCWCRVAIPE